MQSFNESIFSAITQYTPEKGKRTNDYLSHRTIFELLMIIAKCNHIVIRVQDMINYDLHEALLRCRLTGY